MFADVLFHNILPLYHRHILLDKKYLWLWQLLTCRCKFSQTISRWFFSGNAQWSWEFLRIFSEFRGCRGFFCSWYPAFEKNHTLAIKYSFLHANNPGVFLWVMMNMRFLKGDCLGPHLPGEPFGPPKNLRRSGGDGGVSWIVLSLYGLRSCVMQGYACSHHV